jgi:DNA (cytosine-5)-methyltransferase 1
MENVEGILTAAGGSYLKHFLDSVISLGYSVSMEKIYAHEYGVPQRRKRVFIVGNSEGIAFSFPRPVMEAHGPIYRNGGRTLRHAILDLENASLPEIDHAPRQEKGVRYARIAALGAGQTMGDLPEELQHDSYRRRANRRVCDGTPSEKRGGPPSGLKRLLYDEPALTITGSSISEFVHPVLDRTLTVRECARIQTFPDDFAFCGTECQKAQQIGNAIPPLLARSIAEQIKTLDSRRAPRAPAGLVYYKVTKSDAMGPLLQKTCVCLNELTVAKSEQGGLPYAH